LNCNTDAESIIDNSPGFQSGDLGKRAATESGGENRSVQKK